MSSSSTRFLWCKLDKQFFSLDRDIYVCSTYIPPVNSLYIKNNPECPFFELEKLIAKYSKSGEFFLLGDFNARKGKLSDDIENNNEQLVLEEEGDNFVSHKLSTMKLWTLQPPIDLEGY